jgi:hypothetical protein
MARARNKHKRREAEQQFGPPREPFTFDLPEPNATRLRQLADRWRTQRAEAEQRAKDREAIDRYIAIRDNQIPPPWLSKSGPKGEGRQVSRVKQALNDAFPPDGRVPDELSLKRIQDAIAPGFQKRQWKLASLDTISRAVGRR